MSFIGLVPAIYYNAKQYGCACDGATDDTTNLTNAITAASNAGGGRVFLPGFCAISTPITIPANVQLVGAGLGTGIKPLASFSGAQILLLNGASAGLMDLQITFANTTYSSNPVANGIQITGAQRVLLQNLYLQYINGWAVQSSATAGQANTNLVMEDVFANSCAQGFHSLGVTGSGYNGGQRLANCRMAAIQNGDAYLFEDVQDITCADLFGAVTAGSGNSLHIKGACSNISISSLDIGPSSGPSTGATVLIESGTNGTPNRVTFGQGTIQGGSPGLSITAGTQITLDTLDIYNNGTHGMSFSGSCDAIVVEGCTFNSNGATAAAGHYDLSTTTSGHVTISHCEFQTAQGTGANQVANVINYTTGTVLVSSCQFIGSGFNATNIFNGQPTSVVNCPGYGAVPSTPYVLCDGDLASSSAAGAPGANNTAYLVAVELRVPFTLSSIRVRFGTGGNGFYDVGIYDATGANDGPNNLLAHAAAANNSLATASNTTVSPALIAGSRSLVGGNLPLEPGKYWLAVWMSSTSDTIIRVNGASGMVIVQSGTNAGPLPAAASSLSGLANVVFKPIIMGLKSGGWS